MARRPTRDVPVSRTASQPGPRDLRHWTRHPPAHTLASVRRSVAAALAVPALVALSLIVGLAPGEVTPRALAAGGTLLVEGFESGRLDWDRVVRDGGLAYRSRAAALEGVTGLRLGATRERGSAGFVRRRLPEPREQLTVGALVRVRAAGPTLPLVRLYTSDRGHTASILRARSGRLMVSFGGRSHPTTATLALGARARLSLRLHVAGSSGSISLAVDGRTVYSATGVHLGNDWVRIVGLGDDVPARPYALDVDGLIVTDAGGAGLPSPTASPTPSPSASLVPPEAGAPVLVGAGDICVTSRIANAYATAALVEGIDGTVFTAGDNSNEYGSTANYDDCVAKTWGRFRGRIRPSIGNHDWQTADGAAYFDFFGSAAGERGKGWYSYDMPNRWHVVVLNANTQTWAGSEQERWLRADLAANAGEHLIGIWHQPLFSSGSHGGDTNAQQFFRDLEAAGATLVINGHDHDYERFAPQTIERVRDDARGIRAFVVGTGGASYQRPWSYIDPNSEVRLNDVYGVLRLTLGSASYSWAFITTDGVVRDSGTASAH